MFLSNGRKDRLKPADSNSINGDHRLKAMASNGMNSNGMYSNGMYSNGMYSNGMNGNGMNGNQGVALGWYSGGPLALNFQAVRHGEPMTVFARSMFLR